jgi:hypothetical protein
MRNYQMVTPFCAMILITPAPPAILGGNFYGFKPEVGRLDASYGQIYKYTKNGFTYMAALKSGIKLTRAGTVVINDQKWRRESKYYLFGINDDKLKAYKLR